MPVMWGTGTRYAKESGGRDANFLAAVRNEVIDRGSGEIHNRDRALQRKHRWTRARVREDNELKNRRNEAHEYLSYFEESVTLGAP
jgi:hypothetical protein